MGVQAGAITASGTTTITGLGGRPYCILFLGTNQTVYESAFVATNGGGFLGFAVEDAEGDIHNYCEFAILTTGRCSNLTQFCAHTQSAAGNAFTNILYEGSVTAISDVGFTISFSTGSGSHQIHYLAVWDIQPGFVFPYEGTLNGDNYVVDTELLPAFFVELNQWRRSGLTYPKSTASSLWNGAGWGDVSAVSTSTGVVSSQSVIAGQFSSFTWDPPSATAPLGATADPFVLGSICTGSGSYGRSGPQGSTNVVIDINGCGTGVDWIVAQFSECFIADCLEAYGQGGGAIDSEFDLTSSRVPDPEAVLMLNFQAFTNGAGLNDRKRWGFGFATPDYQCGFSISEVDGSFFQSESYAWVAKTSGSTWSGGEVTFTPVSGTVGLITKSNSASAGSSSVTPLYTSCPFGEPLLVSFSGFYENRPSGSQITTRGAPFNEGEGVSGHLEREV